LNLEEQEDLQDIRKSQQENVLVQQATVAKKMIERSRAKAKVSTEYFRIGDLVWVLLNSPSMHQPKKNKKLDPPVHTEPARIENIDAANRFSLLFPDGQRLYRKATWCIMHTANPEVDHSVPEQPNAQASATIEGNLTISNSSLFISDATIVVNGCINLTRTNLTVDLSKQE